MVGDARMLYGFEDDVIAAMQPELATACNREHLVPPVDLDRIADAVGVGAVSHYTDAGKPADGYTDLTRFAPIIYLNGQRGPLRQRFTLAHEIGHVMVNSERVAALLAHAAPAGLARDVEELLCDRIAAELLLPTWWVKAVHKHGVDLETLCALSKQARVSTQMMATRLADRRHSLALIRWQRGAGKASSWVATRRAGNPRWLRYELVATPQATGVLDDAVKQAARHRIDLWCGPYQFRAEAEIKEVGPDVLMLLQNVDDDALLKSQSLPADRPAATSNTGLESARAQGRLRINDPHHDPIPAIAAAIHTTAADDSAAEFAHALSSWLTLHDQDLTLASSAPVPSKTRTDIEIVVIAHEAGHPTLTPSWSAHRARMRRLTELAALFGRGADGHVLSTPDIASVRLTKSAGVNSRLISVTLRPAIRTDDAAMWMLVPGAGFVCVPGTSHAQADDAQSANCHPHNGQADNAQAGNAHSSAADIVDHIARRRTSVDQAAELLSVLRYWADENSFAVPSIVLSNVVSQTLRDCDLNGPSVYTEGKAQRRPLTSLILSSSLSRTCEWLEINAAHRYMNENDKRRRCDFGHRIGGSAVQASRAADAMATGDAGKACQLWAKVIDPGNQLQRRDPHHLAGNTFGKKWAPRSPARVTTEQEVP